MSVARVGIVGTLVGVVAVAGGCGSPSVASAPVSASVTTTSASAPATAASAASAAAAAAAPPSASASVSAPPAASASASAAAPPSTPVACRGLALVLLLDRSGSMTGAPFDATKDAAKAAAKALPAGACLEVAFFDSRVTVAVPLGAVDAPTASKSIDTMTPGGGTEFVSALDASVLALHRVAGATTKRVIFLSDGQAPSESVLASVARIRGEGATLSAIALGRDADEKLLRSMADAGKGRFYIVIDPSVLERIFVREITL